MAVDLLRGLDSPIPLPMEGNRDSSIAKQSRLRSRRDLGGQSSTCEAREGGLPSPKDLIGRGLLDSLDPKGIR
jgi:hypothetical protein